ncbi:EF-1 guanine nucleotide exchange domain family protein [Leishmania donovani]|uniref:EF-1 guanine nucleotide exchange domain family protein n=1 Tax=Leishmania donovani TaxID=5661 RepID=A0A504XRM1_LEIDO|nr:EF-1 guanine nucleotide exchange domain family protein [Leishmania donovani]TPP50447.1 EF-1 guanine nucleotide exchange domain family protein [Leishmania donovani]
MSLKDVSKKAAELESKLGGKLFLGGAKPTAEDVKVFNDLLGANHVNLYRWAKNMATYTEGERKAAAPKAAASSILFDIKAWDDTIDLEALAQKLHAIQRDGLIWGDHKLVPVAFGVKKLQQLIVIEDDKVSGDDLEEMIMGFEEEVQSMDIVAWNKI